MGTQTVRRAMDWGRLRNPLSQADWWARTHPGRMYALGVGAPWLHPPRRFVIVTPGRSGSEMLTDLLRSHPRVVCEAEILRERRLMPERFIAGRAARAGIAGAAAYGFKIHCGHFGYQVLRERPDYLRRLVDAGTTLILLRRDNLLAQAISSTIAKRTRWHWRQQDNATFSPFEVDPVEVLMMTYLFEEADTFLTTLFADLPHLSLTYEDDLLEPAAQQATVARICGPLGIEAAPVHTDHVRFTPRALPDTVANWAEVASLVQSTRFSRFVEGQAGDAGLGDRGVRSYPGDASPGGVVRIDGEGAGLGASSRGARAALDA